MNNKQYQQGDVLFRKLEDKDLSKAEKVKKTNRGYVLADGEHTGHAHCIEEISNVELYRIGEMLLLKLDKTAIVTHEEHGPVTLEPGIWEIGRVKEYDYFQKMERTVID